VVVVGVGGGGGWGGGGGGGGGAGGYWGGGIRGAAFVHSPLLEERGKERWSLIHVVDWFATILGVVDRAIEGKYSLLNSSSNSSSSSSTSSSSSSSSSSIDGIDQWATISHGAPSSRLELLHAIDPLGLDTGDPLTGTKQAAIRQGPWKLILGAPGQNINQDKWTPPPHWTPPPSKHRQGSKCESCTFTRENLTTGVCLFNIEEDPEERCNLTGSQKGVVAQLLARLEAWNATAVPAQYPGPDERCDPSLHGHVFAAWGKDESE